MHSHLISPVAALEQALADDQYIRSAVVGHKIDITNQSPRASTHNPLYVLAEITPGRCWLNELPTITAATTGRRPCDALTRVTFRKQFMKAVAIFGAALPDPFRNNVLIAGGSCVNVLLGIPIKDVDIFIYGLDTTEATRKVYALVHEICAGNTATIINSPYCTTIKVGAKRTARTFQIIHRLYKSREEILYGFDIGSSAVGYDGKDIYFSVMGKFAHEYMCNVVEMSRRSTTYEKRLCKYYQRGFSMEQLSTTNIKYGMHDVCELGYLAFSYSGLAYNQIFLDTVLTTFTQHADYMDMVPRKKAVSREYIAEPYVYTIPVIGVPSPDMISIKWIVTEPGTQINGSINPAAVTPTEWYGDYYVYDALRTVLDEL
jgi:hypothetical protein